MGSIKSKFELTIISPSRNGGAFLNLLLMASNKNPVIRYRVTEAFSLGKTLLLYGDIIFAQVCYNEKFDESNYSSVWLRNRISIGEWQNDILMTKCEKYGI